MTSEGCCDVGGGMGVTSSVLGSAAQRPSPSVPLLRERVLAGSRTQCLCFLYRPP